MAAPRALAAVTPNRQVDGNHSGTLPKGSATLNDTLEPSQPKAPGDALARRQPLPAPSPAVEKNQRTKAAMTRLIATGVLGKLTPSRIEDILAKAQVPEDILRAIDLLKVSDCPNFYETDLFRDFASDRGLLARTLLVTTDPDTTAISEEIRALAARSRFKSLIIPSTAISHDIRSLLLTHATNRPAWHQQNSVFYRSSHPDAPNTLLDTHSFGTLNSCASTRAYPRDIHKRKPEQTHHEKLAYLKSAGQFDFKDDEPELIGDYSVFLARLRQRSATASSPLRHNEWLGRPEIWEIVGLEVRHGKEAQAVAELMHINAARQQLANEIAKEGTAHPRVHALLQRNLSWTGTSTPPIPTLTQVDKIIADVPQSARDALVKYLVEKLRKSVVLCRYSPDDAQLMPIKLSEMEPSLLKRGIRTFLYDFVTSYDNQTRPIPHR